MGFSLLAIVFLVRSFERSSDWKTEQSLFDSGLYVCPLNAKVHYNIAKNAMDAGDSEKAVREYREAIRRVFFKSNVKKKIKIRKEAIKSSFYILLQIVTRLYPSFK